MSYPDEESMTCFSGHAKKVMAIQFALFILINRERIELKDNIPYSQSEL